MNKPWYISSNGENLALTIRGLLVSIIPLVLIASNHYGISITDGELKEIANATEVVILAISSAASSIMIVWGLLRKLVNKYKKQ